MKLISVLAGALSGTIALSVLSILFHWVFFRSMLRDGQYALVLLITVPFGILLGALTSLVRFYLLQNQTEIAGRTALFGGGILTALFLLLGFFVFSGTEQPTFWERLTATLFWFGLPLLWSGILIRTGLRLLAG